MPATKLPRYDLDAISLENDAFYAGAEAWDSFQRSWSGRGGDRAVKRIANERANDAARYGEIAGWCRSAFRDGFVRAYRDACQEVA